MTDAADSAPLADVTAAPQLSLPTLCPINEALEALAVAEGTEERGAVFTRGEVVDFILDLCGYTSEIALHKRRILEPSFGDGHFLLPVIGRLIASWIKARGKNPVADLAGSLRAVELHRPTFMATRSKVIDQLEAQQINPDDARKLAEAWLIQGDFLLAPIEGTFDFVVGNPPYVRQELIPDRLLAEYRARYHTVYDRADLYIPFIERSLTLLSEKGKLGFICADRWTKNRYGGPLRQLVAERFHLKAYVDMVNTPAFHSDVIAYPAITLIAREKKGPTRIARQPEISRTVLEDLSRELLSSEPPSSGRVLELNGVADAAEPWLLEADERLLLVRRIEASFPTLEDAGCKVGIGVATGADKAFIGPFDGLDVEEDRKLRLAMTRDILTGSVQWKGLGVINPFADDGGLVKLESYPRLKRFLEQRKQQIAGRHVAKKAPANWYRTIDRIYPSLAAKPKLLIPDIKGEAQVVFEEGKLYPHHNLYFISSDSWNLEALQAVLMSGIARLFVATYSTKMRGGYLRFQAQYLRRIRVPLWSNVPRRLGKELQEAARDKNVAECNRLVAELYGLSGGDRLVLQGAV